MTNREWEEAHRKAEEIGEVAKNTESVEWFKVVYAYYMDKIPQMESDNYFNIVSKFDELTPILNRLA